MSTTRKFFQDRIVLLLISVNVFLAVLSAVVILLRLSGAHNEGYITEYRSNLGLNSFRPGSASTFVAFILFQLLVAGYHTMLSKKVYHIRRQLALAILGMGTLLIVLAAIVSNALLSL